MCKAQCTLGCSKCLSMCCHRAQTHQPHPSPIIPPYLFVIPMQSAQLASNVTSLPSPSSPLTAGARGCKFLSSCVPLPPSISSIPPHHTPSPPLLPLSQLVTWPTNPLPPVSLPSHMLSAYVSVHFPSQALYDPPPFMSQPAQLTQFHPGIHVPHYPLYHPPPIDSWLSLFSQYLLLLVIINKIYDVNKCMYFWCLNLLWIYK